MAEPFARRVGERLVPVLKDAQLVTLAGIRVTDPWGTIVASTGDDVGKTITEGDEIALALTGTPGSRLRLSERQTDGHAARFDQSGQRSASVRVCPHRAAG